MSRLIHEERLRGVHPQLVLVAHAWTVQLQFDVLITDGVRTNARQAQLFAQGRSTPGKIVTNARDTTTSPHGRRLVGSSVFGCAFDSVPCTGPIGQPNYEDRAAYEAMGLIAERMGMVWGGRWERFPDLPHVEVPGWKSLLVIADDDPNYPNFDDVTGGSSSI